MAGWCHRNIDFVEHTDRLMPTHPPVWPWPGVFCRVCRSFTDLFPSALELHLQQTPGFTFTAQCIREFYQLGCRSVSSPVGGDPPAGPGRPLERGRRLVGAVLMLTSPAGNLLVEAGAVMGQLTLTCPCWNAGHGCFQS